jgi:hypothetical protein
VLGESVAVGERRLGLATTATARRRLGGRAIVEWRTRGRLEAVRVAMGLARNGRVVACGRAERRTPIGGMPLCVGACVSGASTRVGV